jgi:hypothetical protein
MERVSGRALLLALALGCSGKSASPGEPPEKSALRAAPLPAAKSQRETPSRAAGAALRAAGACAERIEEARKLSPRELVAFPFAERGALLAQVKATPVVFLSEPQPAAGDPVALLWRKEMSQSETPGRVLARLLKRFRPHPAFLRDVLLAEGYVYATKPLLAATLTDGVTLGMLFREDRIVIERGAQRLTATRDDDGNYVYADGPELGKQARLFLFDRVFVEGESPGEARHIDVSAARESLASERFEIERVTDAGVVAKLRYGGHEVPGLFRPNGALLELVCEATPAGSPEVEAARALNRRRERAVQALRRPILDQVDEALPFDEPKTEVGQQDGKLRQEWRIAYRQGFSTYQFNEDKYRVFDSRGRPMVPQVCIDFIIDTFERAGGAWWNARGQALMKTEGRIDFDALGMENRRNVEQFLALAGKSDWFEYRPVPPEEAVRLELRERFFATLYERRDEYRPGDVVVIFGLRDDEKLHYHTFFVFDADPVTGMPTLVAGNSGRPRIRALAVEMAPAPKRKLFARLRPRLEWLEHAALPERVATSEETRPEAGESRGPG